MDLINLEGIGPVYKDKLNAAGVTSVEDLLDKGAKPKGRADLEAATGISGALILTWVNMADLVRVKGVGEEYSELLHAAGVDTVVELSKRVPANLHAKIVETAAEKNLVRAVPSLSQVESWVAEAKTMPRVVEH
jgi:predicted flap endonuclease-1-like 5' DNA nuclease